MIIKTKKDAEKFYKDFRKYAEYNPQDDTYDFRFKVWYCSPNQYVSNLICTEQKEFYVFNCGKNWCDHENTEIDNPIDFVWEQRKWINRQLNVAPNF